MLENWLKRCNMRDEKILQIKSYLEELRTLDFDKLERESKFLSIESYKCHLNNGREIIREKILKGNIDGSAALVFAMTEDKEFILAVEPRVFTKETVDVGLPAGYIEKDEDPACAAKRELLEETGYEAKELIPIGKFYQDQGCSAACNHYFLAVGCKKVKEQNLDDGEFIKYALVDYDELRWLIDNNYIKGLNSAYAIEKGINLIKQI